MLRLFCVLILCSGCVCPAAAQEATLRAASDSNRLSSTVPSEKPTSILPGSAPDPVRHAANQLWAEGKVAESLSRYRTILRQDEASATPQPYLGVDLFATGSILVDANRLEEAKSCFLRAIAMFRTHPIDKAEVQVSLAGIHVIQGSFPEAERTLKEAVAAFTRYAGPNDIRTARAWNVLGWLYTTWGRLEDAREASNRAHTIATRILAPDDVALTRFLDYRAEYLANLGRFAEAERMWTRAIDILEKSVGENSFQYDSVYLHLAQLYSWIGEHGSSLQLLLRFLAIEKKYMQDGSIAQAVGLAELGNTYTRLRQYAEAESNLNNSMDMLARFPNPVPLTNALVVAYFGDLYMARGRWSDAESAYRKALALRQQAAPSSALVATSMNELAVALNKLKRKHESKQWKERAQAIMSAQNDLAYARATVDIKSFRSK